MYPRILGANTEEQTMPSVKEKYAIVPVMRIVYSYPYRFPIVNVSKAMDGINKGLERHPSGWKGDSIRRI